MLFGDTSLDLKQCLKVLDLEYTTSLKQVTQAYKDLVRIWHPDRFPPNSRLKDKAEENLRDINIAYEHVIAYLSSKHRKNELVRCRQELDVKQKVAAHHKATNRRTNRSNAKSAAKKAPTKSRQRHLIVPAASGTPRTSSIGKYVIFGFLIILAAVFAFIINYLLTVDRSDSAPVSSILKKFAEQPKPKAETHSHKRTLTGTEDMESSKPHIRLQNKQTNYCEIYLKSGGIIFAETCWQQNNMIMYKIEHGIVGFEKNTVKKVVKK